MRVLMNAQAALGPRTGIGHYTAELARELARLPGLGVRAFSRGRGGAWYERQSARYEALPPGRAKAARGKVLAAARALGVRAPADRLLRLARRGFDLYHEPFFMPPDCGLPAVATVHDLSPLLHPEWHRSEVVATFERHFEPALRRCRHLLAISEFGKSEIVRHLGWPADRVSVTHMGVRPGLRPVAGAGLARGLKPLNLSPGYLLHVGTLEPRKNLPMLLRAYCGLPAAVRERHPLVLAGGSGWKCEDVHDFLSREGKAKNVRWLGYVADGHFAALYSGARALVFPTRYEGFGMPAVEALACGCAVLASTAEAVAEVAGGAAHLADPADEGGWRDAMLRACTDEGWLASLRAGAAAHAAPFTWAKCAEQTLSAYRKALSPVEFVRLTPDRRGVGAPGLTPRPQVRSLAEHMSGSPGRS